MRSQAGRGRRPGPAQGSVLPDIVNININVILINNNINN